MFLSLSHFIKYQLFHVFNSTNFIYILIRILRLTLITIDTTSAIYTIKFLPKLREKELALEQCIKHRLTLETLIINRITNDEQLKKQITNLYKESKDLYDIYIQFQSEENQLSNTIQKMIDNQGLLHHSLPMEKNKQECFLSTLGNNQDDNHSLISNRITAKVSQLCLPSHLFNELDTKETIQTNAIIFDSINERKNHRSKKIFTRILWLKKKKYHNSQRDENV